MTIAFENVALCYGDKSVLRDIDLTIPSGHFVCLIGASGCGKTTLLKLINRLHAPSSGRVSIDGTDAGDIPTAGLPARIGYVVQDAGLFPHMTVAENIRTALELAGLADEDRFAERIDEVLRLVGLDPEQYRDRLPAELSGGQRQRVGIARAVAPQPSILLMDEPFSALDPVTRTQLQDETKRLQQTLGITVVFVTHDMDEAVRLADQIAILEAGRIVQVGAPETIVKHPVNDRVAAFVGCERRGLAPDLITAGEIMSDARATVAENYATGGVDWWKMNVWTHPKRPFLYYNDPQAPDVRWGGAPTEEKKAEKSEEKAPDPDDFSRFTTTTEIKEEAERRLSVAVMNPTEENVRHWMALNAFIQGKAQRFSEAFTLTRYAHPEYDWTSTHPTVNTVVADMKGEAREAADLFIRTIAKESGLIFAGASDDPRFRYAVPIVSTFARSNGFEVLFVSDVAGPFEGRPGVVLKKDNGILARLGVTKLPALVLVAAPGAVHPALRARAAEPRLIASGVISGEEMKRRMLQILSPEVDPREPVANDAQLPTMNASRLLSGEAYAAYETNGTAGITFAPDGTPILQPGVREISAEVNADPMADPAAAAGTVTEAPLPVAAAPDISGF